LGFSWIVDKETKYFVFTVLPFGLTSAPFIFTKVVRPLVKHWRSNSVKIACFLDDGLGKGDTYLKTKQDSSFVRISLQKAGFIPNQDKSIWEPTKALTWLGISIDLNTSSLEISSQRVTSIFNTISYLLDKKYISARNLAKLAGKIISTKFILGDIVQIKTRYIYQTIDNNISWDKNFNIIKFSDTVDEILFWKFNFIKLNKRAIIENNIPNLFIYSDASDTGIASFFNDKGKINICYKNLDESEKQKSSTWRELEAIRYSLLSCKNNFKNQSVQWYTDNFACTSIIRKGSNKSHLHKLALDIFNIKVENNILFHIKWLPREENQIADKLSKDIDYDDWYITKDLLKTLEDKCGKITIDRFASFENRKTKRYNSKFINPETEGVNAFNYDWSHENNLLVPPVFLLPKTINHFVACKNSSNAILVCPYWTSASFWPLLLESPKYFHSFVKDFILIEDPQSFVKLGNNKKSLIGSDKFKGSFMAIRLEKRH